MEAATEKSVSRLPAMFRALRHRNYRLFFSGQIISLVGTWMQSVAQSWLVYRLIVVARAGRIRRTDSGFPARPHWRRGDGPL